MGGRCSTSGAASPRSSARSFSSSVPLLTLNLHQTPTPARPTSRTGPARVRHGRRRTGAAPHPTWDGFVWAAGAARVDARAGVGACGRGEGAADRQLRVVAEAEPGQFVGTKRLEEAVGGVYTWRSVFSGWFRCATCTSPALDRPRPVCTRAHEGLCKRLDAAIAEGCLCLFD
jgi:hypothetical protein